MSLSAHRYFILAVFVLSFLLNSPAQGEPVKIYILAGQSNMEGHGLNGDLSSIDPSLLTPRNDAWCVFAGKATHFLKPGYGYDTGNFGPELNFGHVLGDAVDHNLLLFKSCAGGTTLYDDWLPPSAAAAQGRETGYLYLTMVERFHNLINHLDEVFPASVRDGYEMAGMLWFQGENDSIDLLKSQMYQEHLVQFIHDVRSDFHAPNMPFIIGEINDSGAWVHDDLIRAAQQYADKHVKNTAMIMTSDLDPGYHYDSESIVIIGERFAEAALGFFTDGEEVHLAFDQTFENAGIKGGIAAPSGDPQFVGPPQAMVGTGSLEFDGDDAVTLTGYTGVTGIKDRSCAFWVRTSAPGQVLAWGAPGAGSLWEMGVHASGAAYLDVGNGGVTGSLQIMDGAWHHVALVSKSREILDRVLVRKQFTEDVEIFVDGVPDLGLVILSQEIDTLDSADLTLGSGFIGMLDEVSIHDRKVNFGIPMVSKKFPVHPLKPRICHALADNLIGYWQFDEGAGTAASDSSTNDHTGLLKAGASWQEGKFGTAVHLTAGQSVQMDGFQEPLGPSGQIEGLSVSFWVQTPLWFNENVLGKGNGSTHGWLFKQFIDWAEFSASFDDGGTAAAKSARNDWGDIAFAFGDGYQWQHVVMVYDGGAREMRIYVDDIECGLSPTSCAGLDHMIRSTLPLRLGPCNWGGAFGSLDEVAIWSRPLTSDEVGLLYNHGKGVILTTAGELSLTAATPVISAATGGAVDLYLDGGASNAGMSYTLYGGMSGYLPGTQIPGNPVKLPLNWDAFTDLVITLMNTPGFAKFQDLLDSGGKATATMNTLGPMDPRLVGLSFYFAYGLDYPWSAVSNPVTVIIAP